jgi:hypothetical protein
MQILWMMLVSLGLMASGIFALALVAHVAARTKRP